MKKTSYTLGMLLLVTTMIITSCTSTDKEATNEQETVFIENESGQLEQQDVVIPDNDTVQIKNPETGEWEKMTKKEADEIINASK